MRLNVVGNIKEYAMRMYDINEAAKQLNLCHQTVYKLIREGEKGEKYETLQNNRTMAERK